MTPLRALGLSILVSVPTFEYGDLAFADRDNDNDGHVTTPNVAVINRPTVNLAPGTSVGLAGKPSVSVAPSTPFSLGIFVSQNPGERETVAGPVSNVPPGKRFVVESISADAFMAQPGQRPFVLCSFISSDASSNVYLPMIFQGNFRIISLSGTHDVSVGAASVRAYVDPGENRLFCVLRRTDDVSTARYTVDFAGHLIDAPGE